jgi:FkbM family methyltransferase
VKGQAICRYHNYKICGCKKDDYDECEFDHVHCHVCLEPGHVALQCPIYKDETLFQDFQSKFSSKNNSNSKSNNNNNNTDNHNHNHNHVVAPKKTVLGDPIVWWEPAIRTDDDLQLTRCKHHKRWEADRLLTMPCNSTFVDVGAHYGDTVVTMALHAKHNHREDLKFVAIEPCRSKCEWIQRVAERNQLLTIKVIQACVGDAETEWVEPAVAAGSTSTRTAGKKLIQGNLAYRKCAAAPSSSSPGGEEGNTNNASRMITLDSIRDFIVPLGFLHVDVEGWEARALDGARQVLSETTASSTCWIVAEVWETRKGLSENPEKAIETVMSRHPHFTRGDDLIDRERNMVYFVG